MIHSQGKFEIWTEGRPAQAKKFVVFKDPYDNSEKLIIHCGTPIEAERYCAYLNAVIEGKIKIPRNQKNWR